MRPSATGNPLLRILFERLAQQISAAIGSAWAFFLAVAVILVWAVAGPFLGFSTTWQLVINTGTTIVTFLIVFLIQNSQNRSTKAIQLKLDELIKAVARARTTFAGIEELSEKELDTLKDDFTKRPGRRRRRGARQRNTGGA